MLTGDLLDTIAGWPADKQHAANQAIKAVEEEVCRVAGFFGCIRDQHVLHEKLNAPALLDQALERMQLMPGLLELCSFLECQNLPR